MRPNYWWRMPFSGFELPSQWSEIHHATSGLLRQPELDDVTFSVIYIHQLELIIPYYVSCTYTSLSWLSHIMCHVHTPAWADYPILCVMYIHQLELIIPYYVSCTYTSLSWLSHIMCHVHTPAWADYPILCVMYIHQLELIIPYYVSCTYTSLSWLSHIMCHVHTPAWADYPRSNCHWSRTYDKPHYIVLILDAVDIRCNW